MVTNADGGSIFGGTEEITKNLNNIFKTNISESSITEINQSCIDTSSNQYRNSLKVKTCTPETMGISESSFSILAKDGRIGPFIKGVDQSIENKSRFECALDGFVKSVKDKKSTLEKSAIDSVMNDLKGLGSIKVNKEGCNEQTVNKNTCEYLSQQQCCASVKKDAMENALDVGSCFAQVEDINQSIQIETASACGQEAVTLAGSRDILNDKSGTEDNDISDQAPNTTAYVVAGIIALIVLLIIILYIKNRYGSSPSSSYGGNR